MYTYHSLTADEPVTNVTVLGNYATYRDSLLYTELPADTRLRIMENTYFSVFDNSYDSDIKNILERFQPDYVINCIGIIKPYIICSNKQIINANALFPHILAEECLNLNIKMIQISTDCAFSGLKQVGSYDENDYHDCTDVYGKSKSLGEPKLTSMVIRSSFIGEELHMKNQLLEWAKSQSGNTVNGYTNHYWSGLTTKQLGKTVAKLIKEELYQTGTYHIFSDYVTKYEMLKKFNEKFDLQLNIIPVETKIVCNRTLSTIHCLNEKLNIPSFNQMVDEW